MRIRSALPLGTRAAIVLALLAAAAAPASTVTWTGGTSSNWSDAANWSGGFPSNGTDVIVDGAAARGALLTNATAQLSSLTISNQVMLFRSWSAQLRATSVTVRAGGVLSMPGSFANTQASNRIFVACTDLAVENGGRIDADGHGYAGTNGPGAGVVNGDFDHSGGGHGGKGGGGASARECGATYGSAAVPEAPGSGGGSHTTHAAAAGEGGGVIRLEAAGTVTVDGTITASGSASRDTYAGGGSGGSIYITCATLSGATSGLIRAQGGAAFDTSVGAGGGGRIAVDYDALGAPCAVRFSAAPGANSWAFGDPGNRWPWMPMAGTLWLPDPQLLSPVLDGSRFAGAVVIKGLAAWGPPSLTVSNCTVSFGQDGFVLTVTNDVLIESGGALGVGEFSSGSGYSLLCGGSIRLTNGGSLYAYAAPTSGAAGACGALVAATNDLVVAPASWVYPVSDWTNGGAPLFVAENVRIDTNAGFDADGKGYASTYGPGSDGVSADWYHSGGSYGGRGGFNATRNNPAAARSPYGTASNAIASGSAGGSQSSHVPKAGAGGGVVRIEARAGVVLNGTLRSDGADSPYVHNGGGAGGSIHVRCATLAGSGSLRATGGNGNSATSGAGGGGRITLAYGALGPARDFTFSTSPGTNEWADATDARWWFLARMGTLWLPDTNLLAAGITGARFRDVQIAGPTSWTTPSLTVADGCLAFVEDQFRLTVEGDLTVSGAGRLGIGGYSQGSNYALSCGGSILVTNGGILDLCSGATNAGPSYGLLAAVTNDLAVAPSSRLLLYAHETNGAAPLLRARHVSVAAGGEISASGRGYRSALGPGVGATSLGNYYGGAGYGGRGGGTYQGGNGGPAYGSPYAPIDAGSAGAAYPSRVGCGSPGGGVVRVEASGTVTVDGTVRAAGADVYSDLAGGSAGGSILITADTFGGADGGFISARGSTSITTPLYEGAGGGGRIAVYYRDLSPARSVRFSVAPGQGSWPDAADRDNRRWFSPEMGSLALSDTRLLSPLLDARFADAAFVYITNANQWATDSLTVSNCAIAFANDAFRVVVTHDVVVAEGSTFGVGHDEAGSNYVLEVGGNLLVTNGGTLAVYGGVTNGATNAWGACVAVTGDVCVAPGSWVYPAAHRWNGGAPLFRMSNLYVNAGGGFNANNRGFAPRTGTGKGTDVSTGGGGGGHGGKGGRGAAATAYGGPAYGVTNGPLAPGSGGGCYPRSDYYYRAGGGGGAIRIEAANVVRLEGSLLANGGVGQTTTYAGGGAGGAIYVTCRSFSGATSAVMSAEGQASYTTSSVAGGGGGGRIAVWQDVPEETRRRALAGEAIEGLTESAIFANYDGLVSTTNGPGATYDPALPGRAVFLRMAAGNAFYLQINGSPDATRGLPRPLGYGSHLDIPAGSTLTNSVESPADEDSGTRHACLGWTLFDDQAAFISNGLSTQTVFVITTNTTLTWYWTNEYQLTVAALSNGTVNSATADGWYTNGLVVAGIEATPDDGHVFATWTGDVPVERATDNPLALTMDQPRRVEATFVPAVSVDKIWNGTGTWDTALNWAPTGVPTVLDHAIIESGIVIVRQPVYAGSVTVSNGAVLFTNWTAGLYASGDVVVRSNGLITCAGPFEWYEPSNRVSIVCSNLTVEESGRISVDGRGYRGTNGPGAGAIDYYGSGGGHGGRGGAEAPGQANYLRWGLPYGSAEAPSEPGSGGGSHSTHATAAGAGGGAVWIEAAGTVTIRGTVSANGAPSTDGFAGAGSGGSIYVACRALGGTGAGLVSAAGAGADASVNSGAGGGGRIALHYGTLSQPHAVRFRASPGATDWAAFDTTNRSLHRAAMGTLWVPDAALLEETMTDGRLQDVSLTVSGATSWAIASLTVSNCSFAFATPGFSLVVTNDLTVGAGGVLTVGPFGGLEGTNYSVAVGGNVVATNGGILRLCAGRTNSLGELHGTSLSVTGGIAVAPGSALALRANPTNGATVRVLAARLSVAASGLIDAIGGGYFPRFGPGGATYSEYGGGGGGHGGQGGLGYSPVLGGRVCDSLATPAEPGSGGGTYPSHPTAGGSGGGAVLLDIAGAATIDGTIAADGTPSHAVHGAGAAGGTIRIACASLGGAGSLSARGGHALVTGPSGSGGGGGGRIALAYAALAPGEALRFSTKAGTNEFAALDPDKYQQVKAENGTLWLPDTALLSASPAAGRFDGVRLHAAAGTTWTVGSLTVEANDLAFASTGFRVAVSNRVLVGAGGALGIGGDSSGSNYVLACEELVLTNGGALYVYSGVTNGPGDGQGALVDVARTAWLDDGSWVYPVAHRTNGGAPLFRMRDLVIVGPGGGFSANSRGFASQSGPGASVDGGAAGGAGHGGRGGDGTGKAGGPSYGSTNTPVEAGSGAGSYPSASHVGKGGAGGGVIRIEASGSVYLGGTLAADGGDWFYSNAGGGAGGSVYLQCQRLIPGASARITALGGDGSAASGGGGGGRIALWTGVLGSDRTRILAGQQPRLAVVTNTIAGLYDLAVSVSNGAGYASASPAQYGSIFVADGLPVPGSILYLR